MTIDATGSSSLTKLASAYQTTDTEEEDDYLGREAFLTMLVAQLQNQDPLNPMEGTDFSAQLAQFSSLEQLINLNESIDSMSEAFTNSSEIDASSFIGMEVTGSANSIEVSSGSASDGYYTLSEQADVAIYVSNSDGDVVRTISPGELAAGEYSISWDGTDNNGDAVEDGSYSYKVFANSGSGYEELSTTVTGTVDGVTYQSGKAYLDIDGVLVSIDSVSKVYGSSESDSDSSLTALDYLGRTISYSSSLLAVEDGVVSGSGVKFQIDEQEDVVLKVLDSSGNIIKTVEIAADDTVAGENTIQWDGTDSSGETVSDGVYTYSVETASGTSSDLSGSGEVNGIKYINGTKYLVVGDGGDLVTLSSITAVD